MGRSYRVCKLRGNLKRSLHYFDEVSLFAENETLGLCHEKVFTRFRIRLQTRFVALIRCQAVECNQTPGNIVRAFVRQEISDQVSTASRNDSAPIFGVLLECVSLERIDLVADEARNHHGYSPGSCRCID